MRSRDKPGGCPGYWPGGVRHRGGASLFCGFCMERRKAGSDSGACWPLLVSGGRLGGERESAWRQKSRGAEYRCGIRRRTGSEEWGCSCNGGGANGPAHLGLLSRATRRCSGRRRVSKSGQQDKPYTIPKRLVWEAYRRVKANKGAAGVDRMSMEGFEEDLRGNLYKIWNRMSSGTYFPPPVKAVEIPKSHGGTRILGVPTVGDRSRRRWWPCNWRPGRSLFSILIPMGTGRGSRRMTRSRSAVSGAGRATGWSIWTSRSSSTLWIMISSSRRWRRTPTRNGFCCMLSGG